VGSSAATVKNLASKQAEHPDIARGHSSFRPFGYGPVASPYVVISNTADATVVSPLLHSNARNA